MRRAVVALLSTALCLVGCTPEPGRTSTSPGPGAAATSSSAPRASGVPRATELIGPIQIRASIDGEPLDLANTVTLCGRDDQQGLVLSASNPRLVEDSVDVRIRNGAVEVVGVSHRLSLASWRENPLTVARRGQEYTVSGPLFHITQTERGTVPYQFTMTATCAPAAPVRTTAFAQPVTINATLDGVPVDVRDTTTFCTVDEEGDYLSIVAVHSPLSFGGAGGANAIINRSTRVVSHGSVSNERTTVEFRGDGPTSYSAWRMRVVKDGPVYRITGVDDVTGGSVEIIADCAGVR